MPDHPFGDLGELYASLKTDPKFQKELQDHLAEERERRRPARLRAGKQYRRTHPDLVKRRDALLHSDVKGRLFRNQKGLCKWCGSQLDDTCEIDHIKPMIKGGTDDLANLCVCCRHCNRRKSNKVVIGVNDG